MNKADLVLALAEKAEVTKKDAEVALDALVGVLEEALVNGEEVKLSGFGTFQTKDRAERQGTNPATGATITIPASKTVTFKLSKTLKEKLN